MTVPYPDHASLNWDAPLKQYIDTLTQQAAISNGTAWFTGSGAPVEPIAGAAPGDLYLDTLTGTLWRLALAG